MVTNEGGMEDEEVCLIVAQTGKPRETKSNLYGARLHVTCGPPAAKKMCVAKCERLIGNSVRNLI